MFSLKKLLVLPAIIALFVLPCKVIAADHTVADWKFSASNAASGTIGNGDLVLKDITGHGNSLRMRTYFGGTASFSDECLFGEDGSIFFDGKAPSGVDFVTVDNAPINKETFPNGYTIEILYKMPDDWTIADRWTSLMSRLGKTDKITNDDKGSEDVTSLIHISNCKEIQFIPVNAKNENHLSTSVWSVAMDKAENWYSIVITYDNKTFSTYINGCESFRNVDNSNMQGLYADPNDGRFRIGSRMLASGADIPDRFTRGYIQEIRISDAALAREDWLVPNPEEYLGQYGDNREFSEADNGKYNFVFLPDVQNAVKFKPEVLEKAFNWMVENKDYANIKGVASLGDNVQDWWDGVQWDNVRRLMSILPEGGIRTVVQPGNHDTNDGREWWYFSDRFGPNSAFQKLVDEYVDYSPSGTGFVMDSPAGSFNYKIVTIDMYHLSDQAEVSWLRNVLTEYTKDPVIIVSHDIQNCDDASPSATHLSTRGKTLWNIVKDYDNVFMMVGGHSHGYGVLELENTYGHKVYSVLADYQFSYNGGNAIFKFAEFDESNNKIHVTSFSPYAATLSESERTFFDVNYMTGEGHDDTIDFDFNKRLGTLTIYKKSANLIENCSFEENTNGWTANNNGTVKPISSEGWVRSNERSHDGSYSLKQVGSGGAGSDINLCTFFPIEPGKIYNLTYWEYSGTTNTGGFNRMHAACVTDRIDAIGSLTNMLDCGGFSSWRNYGSENRDPNYYQGWTQRNYTFDTTNAPNARYIVVAYAWGDTDFCIDDFSLTSITLETYSRISLDSVTAVKSGEVLDVTVEYNTDAAPEAVILVAGFNADGGIVSVATVEDGKAQLKGADTITEVKAFCWNGLKNIVPLTSTKTTQPTEE